MSEAAAARHVERDDVGRRVQIAGIVVERRASRDERKRDENTPGSGGRRVLLTEAGAPRTTIGAGFARRVRTVRVTVAPMATPAATAAIDRQGTSRGRSLAIAARSSVPRAYLPVGMGGARRARTSPSGASEEVAGSRVGKPD